MQEAIFRCLDLEPAWQPKLEFELNHLDLPKVIAALGANILEYLDANLALMLWDGRSNEELLAAWAETTGIS